ncbi:fidgetin-like isoform X1 [Anguilla anguilla]|uniref:fidgetin-like isoform X1 n=2 Tax=Anguilla anguilla TaxID=7936 RepID=UPI0015B2C451|nr:fidgetin-like isoform X1 [Anguilla anguilla]
MVSNRKHPRITRTPIHQHIHRIDETLTFKAATHTGVKMQWTPEHAQWAEQHFDISSTTRSPAHKAEAYRAHLQPSYQYAWANDDISALTASNLLKKYAEKYSGLLEGPGERALLGSYAEAAPGLLNGRKSEGDAWQEGMYTMGCVPDVIPGGKSGPPPSAAVPPAAAADGMGGSPGVAPALTEPGYPGGNCRGHGGPGLHPDLPSQEYGPGYNGSYLHSGYGGQPAPALPSPHPSPLHSAGLLQPPPPPTLVPSYNAGSPNLSGYSYPPAGYPPQTAIAPAYSPGGATPSSAYLPSGIAAPTPLPPSTLAGYAYQPHSLAPMAPAPLNGGSANHSLKRKAFYMAEQGEMEPGYGGFGYGQQRSSHSPMYRMADGGAPSAGRGNGFDRGAEASSLAFKPAKQPPPPPSDQQRKFGGRLSPPSFGPAAKGPPGGSKSGEAFGDDRGRRQQQQQRLSHSAPGPTVGAAASPAHPAEEQLKGGDPRLLEVVTAEVVQQCLPVDWGDVAGLEPAKAALKEEVLWPMMRPDVFGGLPAPPRTVLLFGPRGTGRTLLARCVASQLGAAFLRLSGSALASKWLGDGEKLVRASFLVARCRQPAVVLVSEADALLAARPGEDGAVGRVRGELLAQLDAVLASAEDHVLVLCSTSRPEEMDESLRRYFAKRLLVPLPDAAARHQIVSQLLSQHSYCLSDKEVSLLVRRTEGFSGLDVARLCQEAVVGPLHALPGGADLSALLPGQLRPVTYQDFENVLCKMQPGASQKELDAYTEWNKMYGSGQ